VLIGGSGERKTLRLVAKYADACNLFAGPTADVAHKLDVLRRHCDNEGRDYNRISKTMLARNNPFGDADDFLADAQRYRDIGIDTLIFVPSGDPVAYTRQLGGDLGARLRDL
jgi:alkanesulfonate monooxygenase SsuD/methylene tetrahydromethanopterin reductase-like flavin-dependent oxidoreductase (luciferase family)